MKNVFTEFDLHISDFEGIDKICLKDAERLVNKDYDSYYSGDGLEFEIDGNNLIVSQYCVDENHNGDLVSLGLEKEIIIPIDDTTPSLDVIDS